MPLTNLSIQNAKQGRDRQAVRWRRAATLDHAGRFEAMRFAYRFGGKQKLMALGSYPDLTLAGARERQAWARSLLAPVATLRLKSGRTRSHR